MLNSSPLEIHCHLCRVYRFCRFHLHRSTFPIGRKYGIIKPPMPELAVTSFLDIQNTDWTQKLCFWMSHLLHQIRIPFLFQTIYCIFCIFPDLVFCQYVLLARNQVANMKYLLHRMISQCNYHSWLRHFALCSPLYYTENFRNPRVQGPSHMAAHTQVR